ncbi:hypothetical protein [Chryseobacterium fistulae]|uniref:Uncharacterized protein n=1 Tax=Chryseobacterium fistulae TaxID=2675058 RepID=A0A6N4XSS6_9FLAO|nr:hypothetical protein [Chryseobacterium fistulae]CAA7387196.1 hypothetical protein CHRY9393_01504 [Chryseobacterium fistulae]
MGIKIKQLVIFSLVFFSHLISGQAVEGRIKYMKKYAYSNCVYINNNKLDATYLNDKFQLSDKSENLFIDLGKISDKESIKIREFTEKQTKDFTVIEPSYYSETGKANTITADCMNFYESKELDNFIKEIVGIIPKKKSIKRK